MLLRSILNATLSSCERGKRLRCRFEIVKHAQAQRRSNRQFYPPSPTTLTMDGDARMAHQFQPSASRTSLLAEVSVH